MTDERAREELETRAGAEDAAPAAEIAPVLPVRAKGRHFGPRRVADPRTAWLSTRCTPAFRAQVIAAAERAGMRLADYVHVRLGGEPSPRARRNPAADVVVLAKLLSEMGKSGSNLNQIARTLNMLATQAPDELQAAIGEHRAAVAAVMRALGA